MMTIGIKGKKLVITEEEVRTVMLTNGTEMLQDEYDKTLKALIDRINFFTPKKGEEVQGE